MTREEAVEYLKHADTTVGKKIKTRTAEALEMAIKALEEQNEGEWEYYQMGDFQCTNCGFIKYDAIEFNFCPNCGATMKKESEEEE